MSEPKRLRFSVLVQRNVELVKQAIEKAKEEEERNIEEQAETCMKNIGTALAQDGDEKILSRAIHQINEELREDKEEYTLCGRIAPKAERIELALKEGILEEGIVTYTL